MKHLSIVNPKSKSIAGKLGISDKRGEEIWNRIGEIVKEETASGEGDHTSVLKRVWNEFADGPEEQLAFAIYAVRHEEDMVTLSPLEALLRGMTPESVEEK